MPFVYDKNNKGESESGFMNLWVEHQYSVVVFSVLGVHRDNKSMDVAQVSGGVLSILQWPTGLDLGASPQRKS